jgi:bifunctional non-homologous end joining protein LigD
MIQAELLTETTVSHFQRMLLDATYGFQEKHNGHRLIICKENDTLRLFNREGANSSKPLPLRVKNAILSHRLAGFVIDGELVGGTFYIFDAMILGDEILVNDAYEYREARYHAEFDGYSTQLHPVETARTPQQKRLLWDAVEAAHGEGIVSKNMTTDYKQGRADQHWKLKFWKTADAVVIGPSPDDKDSVEIGMYNDRGQMHRISGCSLRNKFRLKPGQVIEVRFLYATKERHIVQPTLMAVRYDKSAAACKLSQLEQYINKNWMVTA